MTKTTKILTGRISVNQLEGSTEFAWFAENYSPNPLESAGSAQISSLKELTSVGDIRVLVFIGTWCPDCHYWVPRLLRLLDEVDLPRESIELIALDRDKRLEPFTSEHRIERLPTFVFLKNGIEIGRITEEPDNGDLLQSISRILDTAQTR